MEGVEVGAVPLVGTRSSLKTDHPLAKAVFLMLGESWPDSVSFDDLLAAAMRRADGGQHEDNAAALERILLEGFGLRMVDVGSETWRTASMPSVRPRTTAVARLESESAELVTSLMHRSVRLDDPIALHLVKLCEGNRDLSEIASQFVRTDSSVSAADLTKRLHQLTLLGLLELDFPSCVRFDCSRNPYRPDRTWLISST